MADTQVLFALTRKYAAMLGQLRKCQDHSEQLRIDLAHVEATIRLFRADWDASGVKATRPRLSHRWDRYGQGGRTALDLLREAVGPMTARELAIAVMERHGLPADNEAAINAVANSLSSTLKRKVGSGVIGDDARPRRWSVERRGS